MSIQADFYNMLRDDTKLANGLRGLQLLGGTNGTLSAPTVSLNGTSVTSEVGQSIMNNQRNFSR